MMQSTAPWSGKIKILVSLLVGLHLLALMAQPMSMFAQMRAADTGLLRDFMAPYVEMFYLDHGYFFFAPNPGPNHLVECRIEPNKASKNTGIHVSSNTESFRFPDRNRHWPRLLYHRHFMRSEFYQTLFVPEEALSDAKGNATLERNIRRDLDLFHAVQASFVAHLQESYPDSEVRLVRIEHQLPTAFQVLQEGWRLNDSRLYIPLADGPAAVQNPNVEREGESIRSSADMQSASENETPDPTRDGRRLNQPPQSIAPGPEILLVPPPSTSPNPPPGTSGDPK